LEYRTSKQICDDIEEVAKFPKIGCFLVIRAMEDFLIIDDIMFDDWTSPSLGGTTKNVTPQIS